MSQGTPTTAVAVSAAGLRMVKLLVGTPPTTVAALIDATNITRTAVTEHLRDLIAAGFVERTTERLAGRGRPRYLYSATDAALLLLFANNQQLVVPAIWRAIAKVGGKKLTNEVLDHVAGSMAAHYRGRIHATKPSERLREMIKLLQQEGSLLEVEEDEEGRLLVHKRSCPFIGMYEETGSVCYVDRKVMTAVVGVPVVRTACRHEGAPCCTFEIVPNGQG